MCSYACDIDYINNDVNELQGELATIELHTLDNQSIQFTYNLAFKTLTCIENNEDVIKQIMMRQDNSQWVSLHQLYVSNELKQFAQYEI